ncbi:MAG: heme ABC transporter ATP-binding protein, partial [Actinomycetota bacterium]
MTDDPTLLGVHGVTTRFPGVVANDHGSVAHPRGPVPSRRGGDGAGTSTQAATKYGGHRAAGGD